MKEENEFVLPENWHVVVTEENMDVLKNWIFGERNKYVNITIGCFIGIVNGKKEWDDPKSDYFKNAYFPNEITFDQFKEYVLKEIPKPEYYPKDVSFKKDVYSNSEFNSESKIVGYKLIKEEYWKSVIFITGYIIDESNSDEINKEEIINWMKTDIYGYANNLQTAGVLDLWFEPVFEEKKIKLTSGIELTEKDIEEVKEILKNK